MSNIEKILVPDVGGEEVEVIETTIPLKNNNELNPSVL